MTARHRIALLASLALVWVLWSGHLEPLLLSFGAASCVLVFYLALRMRIIDDEGAVLLALPKLLALAPTVLWRILVSNIDVAKIALAPSMPIAPSMIDVPILQRTDLGRTLYANIVTLTPGTVTVRVEDEHIVVHALTRAHAESFAGDDLDASVRNLLEGRP